MSPKPSPKKIPAPICAELILRLKSIERKIDRLRTEIRGQKAEQKKLDDLALTLSGDAETIQHDVTEP